MRELFISLNSFFFFVKLFFDLKNRDPLTEKLLSLLSVYKRPHLATHVSNWDGGNLWPLPADTDRPTDSSH